MSFSFFQGSLTRSLGSDKTSLIMTWFSPSRSPITPVRVAYRLFKRRVNQFKVFKRINFCGVQRKFFLWKFRPSLNCRRNRNKNLFSFFFIVDGFGCLNWVQHPRPLAFDGSFSKFVLFVFTPSQHVHSNASQSRNLYSFYWGDHADCVWDLKRNTFRPVSSPLTRFHQSTSAIKCDLFWWTTLSGLPGRRSSRSPPRMRDHTGFTCSIVMQNERN